MAIFLVISFSATKDPALKLEKINFRQPRISNTSPMPSKSRQNYLQLGCAQLRFRLITRSLLFLMFVVREDDFKLLFDGLLVKTNGFQKRFDWSVISWETLGVSVQDLVLVQAIRYNDSQSLCYILDNRL